MRKNKILASDPPEVKQLKQKLIDREALAHTHLPRVMDHTVVSLEKLAKEWQEHRKNLPEDLVVDALLLQIGTVVGFGRAMIAALTAAAPDDLEEGAVFAELDRIALSAQKERLFPFVAFDPNEEGRRLHVLKGGKLS